MTQTIQNQNEKTTGLEEDYDEDYLDRIFGGAKPPLDKGVSLNGDGHHKQQKNHNNNYNNNNYHTEPGVFASAEDLERIRVAYEENIGLITGAVAKMIEDAISHGLSVDDVVLAAEETGLAPRPSAYYFRAILQNWCAHGVTVSRIAHCAKPNGAVKWWKD